MDRLNVLAITSHDLLGSRFNGFDWQPFLQKVGVDLRMLVASQTSVNVSWVSNFKSGSSKLQRILSRFSFIRFGNINKSVDFSNSIFDHPWYKNADLIHLHIVLDGTLSLDTIQKILEEKPTLWTWHDPAFMTGHCVTPMDCFRWDKGCGSCPDLSRPFPVVIDRTFELLQRKQQLLTKRLNVHVSTNWMLNLVKTNPSTAAIDIKQFPFGLDLSKFTINPSRKKDYGFSEDSVIIGIRATKDPYKEFDFFKLALERIVTNTNVVVLTVGDNGLLNNLKISRTIDVVEWPWLSNETDLIDYYNLLDIFISPSRFETFGLMGLEAMACGIPVIGVKNGAVAEVCNLEEYGFEVAPNDVNMFGIILEDFINKELRIKKSRFEIRDFVQKKYNMEVFTKNLVDSYVSILTKDQYT